MVVPIQCLGLEFVFFWKHPFAGLGTSGIHKQQAAYLHSSSRSWCYHMENPHSPSLRNQERHYSIYRHAQLIVPLCHKELHPGYEESAPSLNVAVPVLCYIHCSCLPIWKKLSLTTNVHSRKTKTIDYPLPTVPHCPHSIIYYNLWVSTCLWPIPNKSYILCCNFNPVDFFEALLVTDLHIRNISIGLSSPCM